MDRFILAFVLSLVSVTALGAETIDLGPSDWRKWDPRTSKHTLEGLRTSYGQPVRMAPLNTSLTVTRNPVVPYGSIANGAKSFLRVNPASIAASAAFTGMFMAMDWAWDELNQGWGTYEEQLIVDPALYIFQYNEIMSPTGPALCDQLFGPGGAYSAYTYTGWNGATNHCRGHWPTEPHRNRDLVRLNKIGQCPSNARYDADRGGCVVIEGEFELVSDSQIRELEDQLPFFAPGSVGSAAGDLMERQGAPLPGFTDTNISGPSSVQGPSSTTTTSTDSGNVTSTTTTTTNIEYGPTTITTTNTTTTNTYTNGQPSGTTTTTETPSPDIITDAGPGATPSLDIPTDCEFMPTVCAFLDWFKEPVPMPEPDLPVVVDRDFDRDYEMNLTAECPPPYTVETRLFGSLSISWQPFCDLATLIKPLVVGSAFLLSAFITLGIGRGKG